MKKRTCLVYLLLATLVSAGTAVAAGDGGLGSLLEGEFRLQEGDADAAARGYVRAAEASSDPRLAERAVQVALLAELPDLARRGLRRWRALDADATALRVAELRLALAQDDAKAAEAGARVLLGPDGDWRGAIQAFAAALGRPVTVQLVESLVESDALPTEFDAWLAFGGLAQRLQRPALGETLADRAIERFPDLPRAWLWHAEMAQRRKQNDVATRSVERALALGPLDSGTRLAVAAQLDALGDPEAAAQALAAGDQDDTTLAGRAAYLARADDDEALREIYLLAQAEESAASPARLYLLGQLAELLELNDEALAWYERVPSGLQREQAQLRIAVLLDKADRPEDAIARLRELQVSDSEYGELLRDSYLLEAELQLRRDRAEGALDAYERGLRIFEDDPELIYSRALAYERLDRIADAEADLRRLIALDPENADALNALGYTLADRTDRFDEAFDLIQRAMRLKPETPAIIDSLGWVLYRMGRPEEALPHLRRAFELQRDAEVAAHLGEVLWHTGEKDEARSIWRLGREIDPDNRALREAIERVGE